MRRYLLALLITLALPVDVIAAPRTISLTQMSEGVLLGQIQSTAQLQHAFVAQSGLLAQASNQLGLTPDDFLAVRRAVALGQARYVTVPRHLNGMSGQNNGHTFVDRNVIIPANVHGWEVDIPHPDGMVRVFLPNLCGNISYVRTQKRYRVAAAQFTPVATPAPFVALAGPMSTPAPEAIATEVPVAVTAPVVPAAAPHHLAWLAALVVPVIIGLGSHGGGSNGGSPGAVPTPIPIHTICPTSAIRIR